ncbi:MAG: hypothetical protein J3R72DRAFT_524722 [Linnemannia gamsii]|nr:MAG: hypothetical protein J3R72DRAFT_524722 [Linnemannia gamsii]
MAPEFDDVTAYKLTFWRVSIADIEGDDEAPKIMIGNVSTQDKVKLKVTGGYDLSCSRQRQNPATPEYQAVGDIRHNCASGGLPKHSSDTIAADPDRIYSDDISQPIGSAPLTECGRGVNMAAQNMVQLDTISPNRKPKFGVQEGDDNDCIDNRDNMAPAES